MLIILVMQTRIQTIFAMLLKEILRKEKRLQQTILKQWLLVNIWNVSVEAKIVEKLSKLLLRRPSD